MALIGRSKSLMAADDPTRVPTTRQAAMRTGRRRAEQQSDDETAADAIADALVSRS
jgi:hypothetical protein